MKVVGGDSFAEHEANNLFLLFASVTRKVMQKKVMVTW